MLRAKLSNGVQILGLDAENIKRLQAGQPVLVSLVASGGTDDVLIVYGNTLHDIMADLEKSLGCPLPEPQPLEDLEERH